MAKNIALISTDFHMKLNTIELVKSEHKQILLFAQENKIKNHIWLGDIFDSRISQRQSELVALTEIIEMYDEIGHKIYCIPGNHDKTDYESKKSFLDPYKYHPSFDLIDDLDYRMIEGKECFFLPYFTDEILLENIDCFQGKKDLLFGHFAVTGSRNNNGTKVENNIKPSLFKTFSKVFLGHYHDYQEIKPNIYHLGSLHQNDFGEDEMKGFWVLKDDGTFSLEKLEGRNYKVLKLDLDEHSVKQVDKIIREYKEKNPTSMLRVEVKGSISSVKAFDGVAYQELGIDIKKKCNEIEAMEVDTVQLKSLNSSDIEEKFKKFCEENEFSHEEGFEILKEVLYGN